MTPLVLFVGFLGAGKTRLLKELLPALSARGLTPSVVINDYQNAKVDAESLRGLTAEIRAISGSCVCCGSKEELVEAMEGFQHTPGSILLVEANGTTDSEELIELLTLEPRLVRFALPVQVGVVDAKRWQKRFWHNDLELDQARTASHLVVSRQDEVASKRLNKVRESLREKGLEGRETDVAALCEELVALARDVAGTEMREVRAGEVHAHEHDGGDAGHAHAERHHFASLELPLPATVDRRRFERFLEDLPETVLRAKGIVRFAGGDASLQMFQKVGGRDGLYWAPMDPASDWKQPLMVCIGPEIRAQAIRRAVEELAGEGSDREGK